VKRRELERLSGQLYARERRLQVRFVAPFAQIQQWTPDALDSAAAYVALLHSEAEYTLEAMVKAVLLNAHDRTRRWRSQAVLVNCVVYYESELSIRLRGMKLCPGRAELEQSGSRLADAWEGLGAREYFDCLLKGNHGAGVGYVEALLHPLGIVVSEKQFQKVEGRGVRKIGLLNTVARTDLNEFVILRGGAVHAGAAAFAVRMQAITPGQLAAKGLATARFVEALGKLLGSSAWRG
jgi:hypothetical protein